MPCRLLCLFLCLLGFFIADDLDHVAFEGAITDTAGSPITGARVTALHTASATERELTTNKDGRYRLLELTPGAYELSISANGFQAVRVTGINAVAGTTVRRDFTLAPATVAEQITINADADQTTVDTTRTVLGGTLNRAEVDRLPVESRNPFDLVYLLPHTAPPAYDDRVLAEGGRQEFFRRPPEETGIFALGGGAPFSNNLTIEGFDNNDDRGARERFTPSLNTVEEVQVITNQFAAEYGRASGGRVNLRLRGGANRYHGQGFYFFRDESLNANSFTRNANPERGYRLPYQNQNPGASLGGPILKDRVFFFAGYEYDFVYDHAEIAALVPVASNPAFALPKPNGANLGAQSRNNRGETLTVNQGFAVGLYDEDLTTPRRAHSAQARIDLKLGAMHDAFALVTLARNRDQRGFPGGRRTLDTIRSTGRNSESIALADNIVVSPRFITNLRFQFSRLAPADAPPTLAPVVLLDLDDPRDVIGDTSANPFTRRGNLLAGSTTSSGSDRREDRYQFQTTTTYLRGAHTWRFGFDSQNISSRFVDLADSTGTFTFASLGDFMANRPSRYEHRFNTESLLGNTYTGFFAQDDWRVRPGLTVNAGLRYDNETILDDRNNFGPRLSLAWAPRNSNKTVVRAGYGIFYNRALLRTLDDFVLTSGALRIDTNTDLAEPLLAELKFPAPLAANDPRVAKYGVREAGFLRRLEPGFRISESYQASTGIERELSKGFKIEINYLFNRGLHLWREVNANAPRLPAGFADFAAYLTARDFDNGPDPTTGLRPLTNASNADLVRFNRSTTPTQTLRENGKTVVVFGLNNPSTSNATNGMRAALAAIRPFRPNPNLTQIEELQARGNSAYHGVSFEAQRRFGGRGYLRANYTLSKLTDDGVVNTSSAAVAGDFARERALSLLDARHRVAISGYYQAPVWLARLAVSSTFNFASSRRFSLGANGNDRNLDDVNNDRPNFTGDLDAIGWRRPGGALDPTLFAAFSLPTIGTVGNLPRNAGRGPGSYTLNTRVARRFNLGERRHFELQLEAFNPFNATVFSFGAEFVDYAPNAPGDFLAAPRTIKPRTMRLGLKFEF